MAETTETRTFFPIDVKAICFISIVDLVIQPQFSDDTGILLKSITLTVALGTSMAKYMSKMSKDVSSKMSKMLVPEVNKRGFKLRLHVGFFALQL